MFQDSLMAGWSRGLTLAVRIPRDVLPVEPPRRRRRLLGHAVTRLGRGLVVLGERLNHEVEGFVGQIRTA